MSRLSGRDDERANVLAAALEASAKSSQTAELLAGLRELLDADRLLVYGIKPAPSGYRLDAALWSGFDRGSQALERTLTGALARARGPWALFDPLEPEPEQRDVVVTLPSPTRYREAHLARTLARLGYSANQVGALVERMTFLNARMLPQLELADLGVCRALVCDGARLLAFVGAFRAGGFGERERLLLRRVLAPLRCRLRRERLERRAPLQAAATTALLETLDLPALIVDTEGAVEETNRRGHELLRAEPRLVAEIRDALRTGSRGRLNLTPLSGADGWLVTVADPAAAREGGMSAVARCFALTRHEIAVLKQVVEGLPTKAIASALGCTERTVEFHLTRLYRKTRTDGRAALVARFFAASRGV